MLNTIFLRSCVYQAITADETCNLLEDSNKQQHSYTMLDHISSNSFYGRTTMRASIAESK